MQNEPVIINSDPVSDCFKKVDKQQWLKERKYLIQSCVTLLLHKWEVWAKTTDVQVVSNWPQCMGVKSSTYLFLFILTSCQTSWLLTLVLRSNMFISLRTSPDRRLFWPTWYGKPTLFHFVISVKKNKIHIHEMIIWWWFLIRAPTVVDSLIIMK